MAGGTAGGPVVLAAPDAFKLTASAAEVADAVAAGAARARGLPGAMPGPRCDRCPLSDGGEGFVDVLAGLGGELRRSEVTGPAGEPVVATWRLAGDLAVVEAASACGLGLAGGPEANDPVGATTLGVGELVVAALDAGARRILVGVGGTATTDGGAGALAALGEAGVARLAGVELVVACDVSVRLAAAAERFSPQKGATPSQVGVLRRRLRAQAEVLRRRAGHDVAALAGSGAGGGLAAGLAAVGGRLRSGAGVVADAVGLDRRLAAADVVVTGEGRLDATSFAGKVVGEVLRRAAAAGLPAVVVAGSTDPSARVPGGAGAVDLSARFGAGAAWRHPAWCTAVAVAEVLGPVLVAGVSGASRGPGGR